MSYKDTGLDEYGMPIDSPITGSTVSESAYQYASNSERNAVTNYNLQNFSFGKGSGGTITLGGTVNGNGYFQIKNASGSVIVTGDNTGLTVSSGSITVNSSNGTTVIDALGLNSANNFYSDFASGGAFNTTNTAFVNVTGGSLSSLVLARDTKCFIYMASLGYNGELSEDPPHFGHLATYDTYSGTQLQYFDIPFCGIEAVAFYGDGTYKQITYMGQSVFLGRQFTLAAGTHTLNLQMRTTGGTSFISGFELGLIKLGN